MRITHSLKKKLNIDNIIKTSFRQLGIAMSTVFMFFSDEILEKIFSEIFVSVICLKILLALLFFLIIFISHCFVSYKRKSVKISGYNYKIVVEYGNIFDFKDCKIVIPFDEFFTTKVGTAPSDIKRTSICGQFLEKFPKVNINKIIESMGAYKPPSNEKNGLQSYKPGTLLLFENYLMMAFARLDNEGRGVITRDEYVECLMFMWREINKYYAQCDVCIPILGSGITRLGDVSLSQQELLDIIICSYKLTAYKIKCPNKLHIVCVKKEDFSLNCIKEI